MLQGTNEKLEQALMAAQQQQVHQCLPQQKDQGSLLELEVPSSSALY